MGAQRIGIARVRFDEAGEPSGVERLGIALEPEADYERRPNGGGGCEDPRVTFVEPLQRYVMSYTAYSASGPRIALAVSSNLLRWHRLGLATFAPYRGITFEGIDNKDASVYPVAFPNPSGRPQLAMLHRPLFPASRPEDVARQPAGREVDLDRESIWISYCPIVPGGSEDVRFGRFTSHHRLATPVSGWERLKIGAGAPPILSRHGWLIVYHGVSALSAPGLRGCQLRYSAGAMVLSKSNPRVLLYRSRDPVLTPELPEELRGTVADVVFPSGIDRRDDLGSPDRFDVSYGMADKRVGVARLDVAERPPSVEGLGDGPHRSLTSQQPSGPREDE